MQAGQLKSNTALRLYADTASIKEVRFGLVIADLTALLLTTLIVPLFLFKPLAQTQAGFGAHLAFGIMASAVTLWCWHGLGLAQPKIWRIKTLFSSITAPFVIHGIFLVSLFKLLSLQFHLSSTWLLLWLPVLALILGISRLIFGVMVIASNTPIHRIAIAPDCREAHELAHEFASREDLGVVAIGNTPEELSSLANADLLDEIVLIGKDGDQQAVNGMVNRFSRLALDISIFPGWRSNQSSNPSFVCYQDQPLAKLFTSATHGTAGRMKRLFDIAGASFLLLLLGPMMVIIAIAIAATSSGSPFFRQDRTGYGGTTFKIFKFRTLYQDQCDYKVKKQVRKGDKAITPVGHWLRLTSLDELPQLINVLKGDMSLVGPRPHAPETSIGDKTVENALPDYATRHRMRPGMTGWAQINGYRGPISDVESLRGRLDYDLYYIDNWSFSMDLLILLRTLGVPFNLSAHG